MDTSVNCTFFYKKLHYLRLVSKSIDITGPVILLMGRTNDILSSFFDIELLRLADIYIRCTPTLN